MELSVRAMKPEIRDLLIKRIHELADFTAKSYGASSVVEVYDSYPVLTNSPEETDFARALALEVFGREGVLELVSPMNASEDFAYVARMPGNDFLLGNGDKLALAVSMCTTPATTLTMTLSPSARRCSPVWWKNTVANLWRRTRMKKSLLLWLALMASTSALAEGGKEIRLLGVDPTFAPFEWEDPQGKLAGFDIDLGNAICQQLQAKCVWVESNFDGIIPALKARKFDAILSGMYMTEKRKAQIAFSDKLYNGPVFLVARKNTLQGNTPEQLKGKTIGVEQGSAQETYVNQHWRPQGINIVAYQGADSVVRDLELGRIDGAVLSGMMADYSFLEQPQGKEFAFVGGHLQDDTLFGAGAAIGLRKDDEALRQEINGAIAKILADGTYKKLAGKYFSFDVYSGT